MRAATSLSALVLVASHFPADTLAQLVDAPTPSNFFRRTQNAAIVVGNYAYIDGGEIAQLIDGKEPNHRLFNPGESSPRLPNRSFHDRIAGELTIQ